VKSLRIVYVALRRLPGWLEVLLAAVLLWQLAGVFWQVAAPRARHGNLAMPLSAPAGPVYRPAGLQSWFESVSLNESGPVAGDLTLLAVVSGQRGVALLRWGQASSVAVRVGDEFRPGSQLVAVTASGIVVEQGGERGTVPLPRTPASGVSILPARPVALSSPQISSPAAQVSATSAVDLSRGQLSGGIQRGNLAGWDKGITSYRDGGIAIDDASQQALMQALQLRNGDVLKGINGKDIKQLADISLLYNQLSQQSAIDLSVLRDGTLQTLHYKIKP